MDKSKPFGLILPKKTQKFQAKNSIFDSDSEEEPQRKKKCPIPQAKRPKALVKEEVEDPSIYEYDSIYDDMKAKEVAKIAPKENKPSRYIDTLLKAADKRKKEYERRVERKVQVEREKEGDKFKDKEAFVTSTYKKKMEEMEEEEERERRENQLNEMMDVTKQKDLSGFYRHFLKQSVGEEKIPVFGEKRIAPKIEEEPKIKKEPQSDPEQDEVVANERQSEVEIDPDADKDSDIDSSSEENEQPSKEKHSKQQKVTAQRHESSSSEQESSDELNKPSKHNSASNKTSNSANKSEVSDQHKQVSRKKKQSTNRDRAEQESDDSDLSSSSSEEKENDASSVEGKTNRKTVSFSVDEKPVLKVNIYEKRTVGDKFAEAQARYFQRMSARNG